MKDFLKYQLRNKIIYGVYCRIKADSLREFRVVKVVNNKGTLDFETIEKKFTPEDIKGCVGNCPVYLIVDGKGVLLKELKAEPDKSLIKQLIPTAGDNEFIIDSYPGNDKTYVALARKVLIDDIILELEKAGVKIICLALGPFRSANLIKYFDYLDDEIRVGNDLIRFNKAEQVISDFIKTDDYGAGKLMVDSKEVEITFLPALAVALEYYIEEDCECLHENIRENKKEYTSKVLFQKVGLTVLFTVFAILIVNALFFMHYSDQIKHFENQLSGNQALKNKLDSLQKELEWKDKFMQESGMMSKSRMAFYADRLAGTVPDDIVLEKLEINPVTGKIKNNKEINLRPDIILIGGYTRNSSNLNGWINMLKDLNWVNRVEIVSYMQENEANAGYFSIELGIRNPRS